MDRFFVQEKWNSLRVIFELSRICFLKREDGSREEKTKDNPKGMRADKMRNHLLWRSLIPFNPAGSEWGLAKEELLYLKPQGRRSCC